MRYKTVVDFWITLNIVLSPSVAEWDGRRLKALSAGFERGGGLPPSIDGVGVRRV